ncbi:MAG: hypothetical protein ABSB74_04280 [Tepidisphaeraceae bacterium]
MVDTAGPLTDVNRHQPAKTDSELATLIAVWSELPDSIRAAIVAMVRAILDNQTGQF